eukprot:278398-Rhodomonas_salina.3
MLVRLGFLLDVGSDAAAAQVLPQPVQPTPASFGTLVPVPVHAIEDLSLEASWCEEAPPAGCSYTCVVSGLAQVQACSCASAAVQRTLADTVAASLR